MKNNQHHWFTALSLRVHWLNISLLLLHIYWAGVLAVNGEVSCSRSELYLHLGCVHKRCSISPGVCYEAGYNKINEFLQNNPTLGDKEQWSSVWMFCHVGVSPSWTHASVNSPLLRRSQGTSVRWRAFVCLGSAQTSPMTLVPITHEFSSRETWVVWSRAARPWGSMLEVAWP